VEIEDNDPFGSTLAVVLKKLTEPTLGVGWPRRGKQLASILCFLSWTTSPYVRQVEKRRIDAARLPATVIVARRLVGGDETPVEKHPSATGVPQILQRAQQAAEETAAVGIPAEPLDALGPGRQVLSCWQRSLFGPRRYQANTT
jgi:hypothetical protein